MGVKVTSAVKRNKREGAINKLARYLHPNPTRRFPDWHPRAGQMGSPGVFYTEGVPKLVEELPQQKWREVNGVSVNEPDPSVPDHACDAEYYVIRERPEPASLPKAPLGQYGQELTTDPRSLVYWMRVQEYEQNRRLEGKRFRGILPPTTRERVWIN